MTVAVVILNWNNWPDTVCCVDSVLRSEGVRMSIIVCDNGSWDQSVPEISQRCGAGPGQGCPVLDASSAPAHGFSLSGAPVWLLSNGRNLGFAGGMNAGVRLALQDPACSHVWLLNNDTLVATDALAHALALMQARPDVGLCGATLVYQHDRQTVQAWGGSSYSRATGRTRHLGHGQGLSQRPVDGSQIEAEMACVVGAAMLASRSFIETVGLMREDYFLYVEEMDWASRAKGRFKLAPDCVVYHQEGATIGTTAQGGSPLSLYYLFRNRLRFAWHQHRLWVPLVALSALLDVLRLLARGRWPQARAALKGLLQAPAPRPQRV
jgi:GT2 family glycosyltransferase